MFQHDDLQLRAKPETEDFAHKYTEEGQGKLGRKLLDGYFRGVESLVTASGVTEQGKIKAIEIGCGEGFSTERLRDMLPNHVELYASEYVASLVPKAQRRNPSVIVTEESAYETKHADNSFDLIFLLEVLEHLDYPDKALAELRRILKPGGWLVLGVPREPLWCTLNMARGKYLTHFGNTPGHLNRWSTFMLKRYINRHFAPVITSRTPLPWTQLLAQKTS
ncbi:methyltransferase type 11 [Candidatus Saccharibacteria bacterium CG_4_10_14_0_2_um_filter_52_9]|nr:MAG: methyltransferase type 11 [Candidatus Saccharibacteria bacterium CG_4_10_14_0_2_um_filter_52_9]